MCVFAFTAHPALGWPCVTCSPASRGQWRCVEQHTFRRWVGASATVESFLAPWLCCCLVLSPHLRHALLRCPLSSVSWPCTVSPASTGSRPFEGPLPALCFLFLLNSSGCRMVWDPVVGAAVFLDLVDFFFSFFPNRV